MYKLENDEILTDEIKKAFCKNYTYCILRNDNLTIDINNYLKKLSYTDEKYDSKDGSFLGKAACRTIDVELINAEGLEIENQEFELLLGTKTNDGIIHYINYGKFIVIEPPIKKDVKGTINFTANDYMSKFDAKFNAEGVKFPCTYIDLITSICNQCGIEFGTTFFRNSNEMIEKNPFVNGEQCRLIISRIAKIAFSVAYIGQDNKLYLSFEKKDDTVEEITTDNYFELKPNETTKPISIITLRNPQITDSSVSIKDEELIEEYGENELLIEEEYFTITDEQRLRYLENARDLFGLWYDPLDLELEGNIYLDFNDKIQNTDLQGNVRESYCLNTYFQYNGVLFNSIKAQALTENENKYNYETEENLKEKITEIRINKAEQKIESIITNVSEQNDKISKVTQTVDELNAKIQDIADITTFADSYNAKLNFDNINESEPISIAVYPIDRNISYLYPRNNLFPSDDLFMPSRVINFKNTRTNEIVKYELPGNLLRHGDKYDEFYLGYEQQICQIVKRVGYNADGSTYILDDEYIINYDYPIIPLTEGDYEIEIQGHNQAYIAVRLMASNIYTTQFATKAEVRSQINQTSQEIRSEVSKKVGQDEIGSVISQTSDTIFLSSNNFGWKSENSEMNTDGSFKTKKGNIAGFDLNEQGFSKEYSMNYRYSMQDALLVLWYLKGIIGLDSNIKRLLDINNNNTLNLQDVILILNYLKGQSVQYNKPINGKITIDSSSPNNMISIKNNLGIEETRIGIYSMFCNVINCNSLMLGLEYSGTETYGMFLDAITKTILLTDSSHSTTIKPSGIVTPTVTQTSLATEKKNFEKLENALDIVKDIDIYKYNLKAEKDTDKKHIGFVIGNDFKYSKEVTSLNNDGADIYSFVSLLCKSVQELQAEVNELKEELSKLKGEK